MFTLDLLIVLFGLTAITVSLFWDAFGVATLIGLLTVIAAGFFTKWSLFDWILHNPLEVAELFFGYLLVGVFYSFYKWYRHLHNGFESWMSNMPKWKNAYATEMAKNPADIRTFVEFMRGAGYKEEFPYASENKELIFGWIAYWPISGLITLFTDPLRRLFNWFYSLFGKIYDNITNVVYKSLGLM